jgi:2-hydroxy-3-keto-5-methylthiopentenyl-1-phosphate phosphatase
MTRPYRAIVSSDWNGCLAPSGPFDFIIFHFPELRETVDGIFQSYTANRISLGQAMQRMGRLLPHPITPAHMDAYLDDAFGIYSGVTELIEWCHRSDILFMINTTGVRGYFERVLAKKLIPPVQVISAHPSVTFGNESTGACQYLALDEIDGKAVNTALIMKNYQIAQGRQVLMGDSGGDGPHFRWGFHSKGFLIGCHTKPSLYSYCKEAGIVLDVDFSSGTPQDRAKEDHDGQALDFRQLIDIVSDYVNSQA